MQLVALLVFVGYAGVFCSPAAHYDDFEGYRETSKDQQELSEFGNLRGSSAGRLLNGIRREDGCNEVLADATKRLTLESKLCSLEFDLKSIIDDIKSILEQAHTGFPTAIEVLHPDVKLEESQIEMNWTHYQPLPVIYNWLDKLSAEYPHLITSYNIGYSYENRPIKAIKVSARPGNKAIFIESNIHAIEWISSATSTCFIKNLLESGDDAEMQLLLTQYDWIVVPVVNPDGFVYSHDVNRLWRKNRKPTGYANSSGPCYGTDLNRNFDFTWGVSGFNSHDPCDHWYAGAEGVAEPEVAALKDFVSSIAAGDIRMYLAFHSYGNFILLPYGHTSRYFPPNYNQMLRIAAAFAEAAKEKYGTEFKYGASGILNYHVSGASKDWAYEARNIPFAATLELRDKEHGFFLPPSQILEVCDEVTAGLKSMIKKAKEEGIFD